jgi:hypothetical protein
MRSCLIDSVKRFSWLRIALIAGLTLVQSSWTCVAIVGFQTCLGLPAAPQITSLSPNGISANVDSVLLMVSGNDFEPQSQILWNGNALSTTFIDSQHLQATITQQTFAQFGGAIGNNVLISVNTPVSNTVLGCPIPGSSATLILIID